MTPQVRASAVLFGLPEASIATAWVGQDFAVPAGFHVYRATIDYDWRFGGHAFAVLGVSVVNMDTAVLIDNRDGTFT